MTVLLAWLPAAVALGDIWQRVVGDVQQKAKAGASTTKQKKVIKRGTATLLKTPYAMLRDAVQAKAREVAGKEEAMEGRKGGSKPLYR